MMTPTRWLPLLLLVPLWVSGLALDRIAERQLLAEVHERLEVALHAHQQYVLIVLQEQREDLAPIAREVARELASGYSPHPDLSRLSTRLTQAVGCLVSDGKGRVAGRAGELFTAREPGNPTRTQVSDPFIEPADASGRSVYEVSLPLTQTVSGQPGAGDALPSGPSIGTLVCRLSNVLSAALSAHRQGLKLTGEVYLVSAKTKLMLTESRFIPNAVGRVTVDTIGVREALKMRNGVAPYPDYRGVPVVGAFLYLHDYDWVLLAEMDEAEALAPLMRLRVAMVVSLGLMSIAAGLVGWRYERNLTEANRGLDEARVKAEAAQARLESLFKAAADTVIEIDEASTVLLANAAAHRMFGWPAGQLIGQNVTVLLLPEDREKHLAGIRRFHETGEGPVIGRVTEVVGCRRDGTLIPCELSVAAMTQPAGQCHFVGILRDITEREQMQEALRASKEQFRQAIEYLPVGIGITDLQDNILLLNTKFIELFGYTREDLPNVADWWPRAYPDEAYRERVTREWYKALERARQEHREIEPQERTVVCKDGSRRDIRFGASCVGERWLVTFVDITERKQAEEALRKTHAELEAKARELEGRVEELERFRKATVQREFRIKELKDEIERLKRREA